MAGQSPIKRNRFVRLQGGTRSANRDLEAKARALAGWKGYVTNLPPDQAGAEFVIAARHQLITTAHPLPNDLRHAISAINTPRPAH